MNRWLRLPVLATLAAIVVTFGAVHAEPPKKGAWPPLPSKGFIRGRAATVADVNAGNAVFVAKAGDRIVGRPLEIAIPQYAYLIDADSEKRIRVVIIQAEHAQELDLIGYRELATGEEGIATLPEFELLGTSPRK